MSGACLSVGALALHLATGAFTLEWTHSVERIPWREEWRVEAGGLRLVRAAVRGSGAGMEPGEGARLVGGWWVWEPDRPPVPELDLAASGATGAGWRLCADGACRELGAAAGAAIRIAPCAGAGG
ncbi:MAG: DUF1850 domain-containing protein [Pseudomonadota bacterium]